MAELIYKDEVYAIVGAAQEVYYQLGTGFLEAGVFCPTPRKGLISLSTFLLFFLNACKHLLLTNIRAACKVYV